MSDDVTINPSPTARSSGLHRRLTVALTTPADRARVVDTLLQSLHGATQHVGAAALQAAAARVADGESAARQQSRDRLEAELSRARHDRETCLHQLADRQAWRDRLLAGASWAVEQHLALADRIEVAEVARAALDERRHEHRAAQQKLERVLEQRAAASAAIEKAEEELAELPGLGMDESGLRRELEAAGRTVSVARQAHQAALARLAELTAEHAALTTPSPGQAVAAPGLDPPTATGEPADRATVAAVRDAYEAWREATELTGPDPQALALADAWSDLCADLAEHLDASLPHPDELAAAHARVERASVELAELSATEAVLSPVDRAALDAAHGQVLAAEEGALKRVGGGSARKRLDGARQAEQELLERHGFVTYLDVVLSGGRASADNSARVAAEREHLEARRQLEELERRSVGSPEAAYLESERKRLHDHIISVLGFDPEPNAVDVLRTHRNVPSEVQGALISALESAGVTVAGVAPADAASAFLAEQDEMAAQADHQPVTLDSPIELARAETLAADIATARSEVSRTDEELHLAERSVVAFEGELSVRAGEDLERIKRFAAVEQMRVQVDALTASLTTAEQEVRTALEASNSAMAAAEVSCDEVVGELTELARHARGLADDLPIDQRPTGDPLASLEELAGRLEAHAVVIQPEIDAAETSAWEAGARLEDTEILAEAARARCEGPMVDDITAALEELVDGGPSDAVLLLDDAFAGSDSSLRDRLLTMVVDASARRQIVLLTTDTDTLSWAIELPAAAATAVPAASLVTRAPSTAPMPAPSPAAAPEPDLASSDQAHASTSDPVDLTDAPTAAVPARRWAGQR